MAIAALVVSVLALLVAAPSAGYSRKSANAATKSAAAAVNADQRGQAEADAKRVIWEMSGTASSPVLFNRGTHTAHEVVIDPGPDFRVNRQPTATFKAWPAGESKRLDLRPVPRVLPIFWKNDPGDSERRRADVQLPRG
jgi:type II secretory pathway pseudopilin PulG